MMAPTCSDFISCLQEFIINAADPTSARQKILYIQYLDSRRMTRMLFGDGVHQMPFGKAYFKPT